MARNERSKIKVGIAVLLMILAIIQMMVIYKTTKQKETDIELTGELARAKAYNKVEEGEEAVEGTENVKFDAFFLRDLEGNGYATAIRGTCKEIGTQDTLYMEIKVQKAGVLKDAKIMIDGKNFYLQTTLPKDEQLANSYIGSNIKEIKFNDLQNGTQKLLTGKIGSTNIDRNINNYSIEDNKIILTGTYVGVDGKEIEILKEVNVAVDWYGIAKTQITSTNNNGDIEKAVDEEEKVVNLDFTINTEETVKKLILKTNHIEGEIPKLNGYEPITVIYTGTNATFSYNEETRKFTIERTAVEGENGQLTSTLGKTNSYSVRATYPIEAYQSLGTETIQLSVPVKTYYEGYNNPNQEFENPYKTNVAQATVVTTYEKYEYESGEPTTPGTPTNPTTPGKVIKSTTFEVTVGKIIYSPSTRYIVSKQKPLKIYNGQSEEEKDDTYTVMWRAFVGTNETLDSIVMKETKTGDKQVTDQFIKTNNQTESVDDVVANVGIYFSGADTVLGAEGEIRVYDEDTDNLLATFTKDNWNRYTAGRPYKYEMPVKHIRIETSKAIKNEVSLYVYNIKEIYNDAITTKYEKEQFDELKAIKTNLEGYIGSRHVRTTTHQANYEAPKSIATIGLDKNTISTQYTEKNVKLTIQTQVSESDNIIKWKDGEFLIKFPEEIIDVQVNNISINNTNVKIANYEVIEQDGEVFIKILTNNITAQNYTITIDADISADPRKTTSTKNIELYATNGSVTDYHNTAVDIYDVNNNLNTTETVNYSAISIRMLAPNSLLTNQTASNYDKKGSVVVSPKTADIKPVYAVVDQEEQTAQIEIQVRNNYSNTISEVQILGKIPFEGNTYVENGGNLGSTFTTKMTNAGVEIPNELEGKIKVYYSERENPNRDLSDSTNEWKTAEQIENWDNIKTFLIDFEDYIIPIGKEMQFSYTIVIPSKEAFNKVSYSHHAVYFCLDTENGKYVTQVEPSKLGFIVSEQYDLEIQKYQVGKDTTVAGATYSVTEIGQDENGKEIEVKTKSAVTNINGILKITNLYANKTYEIKETKTPDDYEINLDVIRFISNVDEQGNLSINKVSGETRGDFTVTKNEAENYKVSVKVEDEVKATLKITKKEQNTENKIKSVRYKLTGYGIEETGIIVTTNGNGEANIKGLSIGQEYTLTEVKVPEGYGIAQEPIIFKMVNNGGNYTIQVISGNISSQTTTEENSIPTINVISESQKIPTYNLEITKVKRVTDVGLSNKETEAGGTEEQVTYLAGAKFKIYKNNKEIGEYITGEDGKIAINNLYQYIEGKSEDAIYTLKETVAPQGYAKVKDIVFKVEENEGLKFINVDGTENKYRVDGNTIKLTIEDSPSFKLINKDGETGELLANIKFAIYNIDNGEEPATNSKGEILGTKETINGKEYYVISTDNNGEIVADFTEGLYKAVEVQAPEKYEVKNNAYYFGIGASREGTKDLVEEWGKVVGGSTKADYITDMTVTQDGGYAVAGYFNSKTIDLGNGIILKNNSTYYENGLIIKYDAEGNVEWGKVIGGSDRDDIRCITETSDGGYIIAGSFNSKTIQLEAGIVLKNNGKSGADAMIIKYTANGNIEWAKQIGGDKSEGIYCIAETSDGGFAVGGMTNSTTIDLENEIVLNNNGDWDGMLIKYDAKGNEKWGTTIGGEAYECINCITETSDKGYLVGGIFSSTEIDLENGMVLNRIKTNTTGSYSDGMVIKYDSNGKIEWGKGIIGNHNGRAESIDCVLETSNGGYIAGGRFGSSSIDLGNGVVLNNNNDSSDGIIIKYSESGEVEWGKVVGGSNPDQITCITETQDGGYVVGGNTYSGNLDLGNGEKLDCYGGSDGMLIKYDSEWNVDSAKLIGGDDDDKVTCIIETSEESYIIGGNFESRNITLGNGEILQNLKVNQYSGMIIKCNEIDRAKVEMEQAKAIGGRSNNTTIDYVINMQDGGYITAGNTYDYDINIGNGTLIATNGNYDGLIIKYKRNGEAEWGKTIGGNNRDYINGIIDTSDGGCVITGYFQSRTIDLGNDIVLKHNGNTSYYNGMIIKYDTKGNVEWGKSIAGNGTDEVKCIAETEDGGYLVGGYFTSESIELGNGAVLNKFNNAQTGMIIKYDEKGNAEWCKEVGIKIEYITKTKNEGYRVIGYFNNNTINLTNGTILKCNGLMNIKYNEGFEAQWGQGIDGTVNSIAEMSDGGYIIGDNIYITKYDRNGNKEWINRIGSYTGNRISYITETSDGGYAIGGYFYDTRIYLENGIVLKAYSQSSSSIVNYAEGMIVKYNSNGKVEWGKEIKGNSNGIKCIIETSNGEYMIGGSFSSNTIEFGGKTILKKTGTGENGMVLKISAGMGVPEAQELVVENTRKEYKITTVIKEIDGIKGGTISGEGKTAYEKVKYGDSNTKEIKITPEENYEIIKITINGEEQQFTANEDGTYIMPTIENVTEDKKIEVTFAKKDNKITINKVDRITRELLPGAKFRLDQLEERTEPENVVGEIEENGQTYYETDKTNEIAGVLGELTENGATATDGNTYNFVEQDGKYIPTNGKTYQLANGGTAGIGNTTANSYIKIDLTNKEGKYKIVINAEISSQSSDIGYATITETTTAPTYSSGTGRFIYISGTQVAQDYESTVVLEGGKEYYLHLGYYKNASTDTGEDQIIFNSIKVYGVTSPTYNFESSEGKYESNNQGKNNTVANSYIPIDLRGYNGKYNLKVNAQVSSQVGDYGYATVTQNTTRPAYSNATGRFIYITGEQEAQDYTTVLEGGKLYYLHLGYYKNASISEGEDKFTINNIEVTLNDSELYHTEIETNSEGQAVAQIPFGKYNITEIEAPEGYVELEESITIEFRADEEHEFTIENDKKAKVIINYYKAIKNEDGSYTYTEEKLKESEIQEGKENENYTSTPYLELEKYKLIKDENGEYAIPENATGKYTIEDIIVNYYYVEKEIPLTVHHYIEGTEEKVPLKDETEAADIEMQGKENEEYETTAISDEELNEEYELVEVPENATGKYEGEEVVVTYYYKKVKREVIIRNYIEDGVTPLEGVQFTIELKEETESTDDTETSNTREITGDAGIQTYANNVVENVNNAQEYTTNAQGRIKVELEAGTYILTQVEVPRGYQILEEATRDIEVTKETENIEVNVTNERKMGTVITHHYIEGTEERVPLEDGKVIEDVIQTGMVGEPYGTKISEEVPVHYEYVSSSEKTYGEFTEETQEVIYYYKIKEYNYTVEYYYDGIKDENATETIKGKYKEQIEEYPDKAKEGYKLEKTENLPLTIEQDETQNAITIYYVKRNDLKYTVNYLEKDTENVLKTQKVVENQEFETVITSSNEIITIDGYEYAECNKESITIQVEESQNVINLYYTKRQDLKYTVNYLEEGTNKEIKTTKVEENQEFQKEITVSNEVIEIDGYNYVRCDKESITIQVDETQNVINIYYTKRNDLKYTVKYLEKGTNKEIKTEKVEENQEFQKEIIASSEVIEINGYKYDSCEKESIIITTTETSNVINLYYTKRADLSYTVNYLEKDTEKVLHEQKIQGEQILETAITAENEKIDIEGYVYNSSDKESITVGTDESKNVINLYYTKRTDLSYTVNYLEKDTEKVLSTQKKVENQTYESIITASNEIIQINGYNYNSCEKESIIIQVDETENVINMYYTKRNDLKYTINYLEKDTEKVLNTQKRAENQEFETVITSSNEIITIEGYVYDSVNKESITIQVDETENVINIYYTKRQDLKYTVNYLEKGTNKEIQEMKQGESQEFEAEIISSDEIITIEGYVYDSVDKESITIKVDETQNVINIYYAKRQDLKYTVNYLEKDTNNVLSTQKVVENQEFGTEITASKETIEIEGYVYDSADKESITIKVDETQNVINIYYTKRQDLKYTVNYLEKETNKEIQEAKQGENQEFEAEIISSDEIITIEGYVYDSCDKERITIQVNETQNVINIYYTKRQDLKYTVNYLEEDTNEELHTSKVIENQEFGTIITANSEVIEIEGYEYSSSNKESITIQVDETQNVINIYYIKRSDLKYMVNYLEKDTNEVLKEQKEAKDQVYGGIIKSDTEVIEIEGYKFDSYDKESITLQVDETQNVINIYYTKRTDIKYKVEYYYDGIKDEEMTEEYEATFKDTIEEYEDKIRENYVLVEVKGMPLTIVGDESKNIIEVYYASKTTVKVQYIDKTTDEVIEEITEEGYVGKEFVTEAKDLEGYILVEEPEEKTVIMKEEEIVLKYYYIYVSKGVIEKHIDIDTDEILYNTTYEGNEGDEYKTEPREFEGYDFVEDKYPENSEGTMAKEVITVNYYYKKKEQITITVKYIDKETKEEIEEQVVIKDYKEKEYKTEQKEIEGYEFAEVEGETEGILTEDKEVVYYYQKIKEPEIPGEGGADPDIGEEPQPEDPTITDKVIPSAGLTKEIIAIITVSIMCLVTGIIIIISVKGVKLDKKH